MTTPLSKEVTQLLADWGRGDRRALDRLIPLVYDELHRLARRYMRRERPDHTLQTSALINEAYIRLIDQHVTHWHNRAHFFAIAAKLMRRVMVDYARSKGYAKRAGTVLSLDEEMSVSEQQATNLVALDEALVELESMDPRKSQIVELRFFGGLNIDETAAALGISGPTVEREWRVAKAWLRQAIEPG